jgi:two-component system, chemotaxis family, protein-glutamate methylesterase/glutaminase
VSARSPREARPRPIRVLVVDDSLPTQRAIASILSSEPGVEVVARATDGEEALREALRLRPDVICLDLSMPRMDGFAFLRLLMARQPTPVIVVSSFARKTDVFKALELGALDFIAKPDGPPGRLASIGDELLAKIRTVRALRLGALEARATGGPPALQHLLCDLPGTLPLAVLVAQHMPERFTRAFADRVGRLADFRVSEAVDGERVLPGRALVAPGGHHLRVEREGGPLSHLRVRVHPRRTGEWRYCPSIDLLLQTAAEAAGGKVCGVILTGMGNDGSQGIEAVKRAGGLTLAESEETAVVYGMPKEAIATGRVDEVLSLDAIVARLVRFAHGR